MSRSDGRVGVDRADVAALDMMGERVVALRTIYRRMVFPRHSHEAYTIGVGLLGSGSIWYRGASHVRVPGDIVVIPPGALHTGGIAPRSEVLSYFGLHIPVSLFERCAEVEGVVGAPELPAPVMRDERIARVLLALNRLLLASPAAPGIHDEPSVDAAMAGVRPQEALTLAIAAVVRHHRGRTSNKAVHDDPAIVRVARDVMRSCYADAAMTSLDSLAARVGVTSFHLIRTFTRATGTSPHQYLLQVRVERARALLESGASPALAAALVGFVDQSHLTAHFKRYMGTTPGHYRRCIALGAGSARASSEEAR